MVVIFIGLTGAVAGGAAQGADPNEAASTSLNLQELDAGAVQEIMTRVYTLLAEYGLKIVGALVIFIVGRWVAGFLSGLAGKAMTRAKMDETLVRFVQNLYY